MRLLYIDKLDIHCFLSLSVLFVDVVHHNEGNMDRVIILCPEEKLFGYTSFDQIIKVSEYLLAIRQDDEAVLLSFIVKLYLP